MILEGVECFQVLKHNMRLSNLQKYILRHAVQLGDRKISRDVFLEYRPIVETRLIASLRNKTLTRSLERLIDREFMTGYGVRTPHKWFIREVKLTTKGRREARKLLGVQQQLPFTRQKAKSP